MSSGKVLIVEDDASIGMVVSAALAAENIETQVCDSVIARDAALASGSFDLMLTDVVLKDSDGLETLREAMAEVPDMPVIIMSAQNTLDTAVRASEIDAFEYFPKPFDLNELITAVKQGISRNRNMPDMAGDPFNDASMPMIGRSAAMQDVYRMVARLLRNDLSVLISGESGTGKELVAEAIHSLGHRKTGPFVAVNMAAIPSELIEAELFGHEKGAFTGAVGQSIGRFEQAQGGTLFLDEIGDMPTHAQTRLLRALQSGIISRIGGKASIRLDVRIVAATHQNLEELIEQGKFREDLYYRLNVFPIYIPPLRERREDIGLLVRHFLSMCNAKYGKSVMIDESGLQTLQRYDWPGNVRELQNIVERLVIISDAMLTISGPRIAGILNIEPFVLGESDESMGLYAVVEETERRMIEKALRLGGSTRKAAALLKIDQSTIVKKAQKLGVITK